MERTFGGRDDTELWLGVMTSGTSMLEGIGSCFKDMLREGSDFVPETTGAGMTFFVVGGSTGRGTMDLGGKECCR